MFDTRVRFLIHVWVNTEDADALVYLFTVRTSQKMIKNDQT